MRKTWVKRDNIYYKPFYKQKLKMTLLGVLVMAIVFFGYQFFYISQLQIGESGTGAEKFRVETAKHQPNDHRVNSAGNEAATELVAVAAGEDEGGGRGGEALGTNISNGNIAVKGPSEDNRYVYVEKIGNYEKKILRGIRLRDLESYSDRPSTMFHCLTAKRDISWNRVNDDYCDCPEDGSDEPSTNACARGRFYCRFQKRHQTGRGGYTSIPSSWVNDGVCDCCDGSDEWLQQQRSSLHCRNRCKEKYRY